MYRSASMLFPETDTMRVTFVFVPHRHIAPPSSATRLTLAYCGHRLSETVISSLGSRPVIMVQLKSLPFASTGFG